MVVAFPIDRLLGHREAVSRAELQEEWFLMPRRGPGAEFILRRRFNTVAFAATRLWSAKNRV
jgi:hypothetical protein